MKSQNKQSQQKKSRLKKSQNSKTYIKLTPLQQQFLDALNRAVLKEK